MTDAHLIRLKIKAARSQIASALDLFIRDHDPVAVQALACGGAEVLDTIARRGGKAPFLALAQQSMPHLADSDLFRLRNQFWNAFKHLTDRNNQSLRSADADLLERFEDKHNDDVLFTAWWDYALVVGAMPIEAQVFQSWWLALNERKLAPGIDPAPYRQLFPGVATRERHEQKRELRRAAEKWRRSIDLLADPRTEPRLLMSRSG